MTIIIAITGWGVAIICARRLYLIHRSMQKQIDFNLAEIERLSNEDHDYGGHAE